LIIALVILSRLHIVAYCVHDLRACPSERVGEDGRICVEPSGACADGKDRAVGVAGRERAHYGQKSEKAPVNAEQLALGLSGCVIEAQSAAQSEPPPASKDNPARAQRKSRALAAHLRREIRVHLPGHTKCPCCSGELRKLGEDSSEMLEYLPASFYVIRHVRPKMSCRKCSCVVQAPAPDRVIDRGLAGPGLLAHVVTAKFATTRRCIASRRSLHGKASSWIVRFLLAG
jgi:hypothetical protein